MFHYDKDDGTLQTTEDNNRAAREQAVVMLKSDTYRLAPAAVPGLQALMGPAPDQMTTRQAKQKVRRALDRIGLGEVSAETALDAVDNEWRLRVEVGKSA
jgi:hypothetical protein